MKSNSRVFNFSAGPANLPESVLKQAQEEMLNYQDCGMSVMEMSHRSKDYEEIHQGAIDTAKRLMGLGDDYSILFIQGGASQQFAMVPLNFVEKGSAIDVVHTGAWTKKAMGEYQYFGDVHTVASGESKNFVELPKVEIENMSENPALLHYCSNNTIFGTQWKSFVHHPKAPTVIDMSSDFLSRDMDFTQFDLIYAGSQKNLGPAGMALVAIKNEMLDRGKSDIPKYWQYRAHKDANSLYNTSPTYTIYLCGLVLSWIEKQGGLKGIESLNQEKAGLLYSTIDQTDFYSSPVKVEDRSPMNIVFRVKNGDEALEKKFIEEAKAEGLVTLKGHRSVGGLRASIYNAHPIEGVKALCSFMKDFEQSNG
ncbi:MAG: 3-phosphoserine/phosphohydroxythreonine aminotransferase [Bdellovibrionaceae bacterium]|nr:3-phosphoserine/phosphohydroxythreonine aminotransferase [Pseudobdellovibrionaceae bacterium]|tara:strand:+ start:357 stop:1454 length:1098 start_codon:yes stop_codon:yes gene_type:complete